MTASTSALIPLVRASWMRSSHSSGAPILAAVLLSVSDTQPVGVVDPEPQAGDAAD